MEIIKFQSGGIVYTPYFSQQSTATTRSSSSSSSDNDEEDSILKEIMSVLNEYGLPTDVDTFLSQVNRALSSNSVFPDSGNYSMNDLIRVHSLANKVRYNNDLYNSAGERLTAENSWSEVAITDSGRLYVVDNQGKVSTISPESYYNNSNQYSIMTNEELMRWRANNGDLAFNDSILNDLNGSTGMNTVIEHVFNVINQFKAHSYTTGQSRYVPQSVINGMENIGVTSYEEGMVQITEKVSKSHTGYSNETEIADAVNYLYNTLTPSMRNTLRAHVAAEGRNPNSTEDVLSLLFTALYQNTAHNVVSDIDVGKAGSGSGSGSGSSGSDLKVEQTFGNFVMSNSGSRRNHTMVVGGSNLAHEFVSYFYSNIQTPDKQPMPSVSSASESLTNLRANGLVDASRPVFFGDIQLTTDALGKILVDNDAGGEVIYLPVNSSGNPDFYMLGKMATIQKIIVDHDVRDPDIQTRYWETNGFEYDPTTGKVEIAGQVDYRPFFVQTAYTSTSTDIISDDNALLEASLFIDEVADTKLENLSALYNVTHKNADIDISSGVGGNDYKSYIYIPMPSDNREASLAGGALYTHRINSNMLNAQIQGYENPSTYNYGTGLVYHPQGYSSRELD